MKQANVKRYSLNLRMQVVTLLALLLLSSCVTNRKTTYLRGDEEASSEVTMAPENYRVQISDNLFVRVITPDPKWAAMFNTLPITATSFTITEQVADLISYPVLPNGAIDMPYIGEVQVEGKTVQEIKKTIKESLVDFITDYDVTVRLVNNYVSLLGDVAKPGKYPIYKNQLNIFQALAMANDMDDYADRKYVQVIRQTPDGILVKDFDLTKRDIIDSEFFYVMPNDVIYAKPMKGKFFNMNTFPFALILTTISTTVLLLNYIK